MPTRISRTLTCIVLVLGFLIAACGGGGQRPASEVFLSSDPVNGATGVSVTKVLSAVFSEDLYFSTVNDTNVTLTRTAGNLPIFGYVVYDVPTRTVTFTPSLPLEPGFTYALTISAAVVTKAAGDLTITFTTQPVPILGSSTVNLTSGADTGFSNAFTMQPDGSAKTAITSQGTSDITAKAWSPDQTVFVAGKVTGSINDLIVITADGSSITNITHGTGTASAIYPVWSPHPGYAFYCLYRSDAAAEYQLQACDLTSCGGTRATNSSGMHLDSDFPPVLSPDGFSLLFQQYNASSRGLYLVSSGASPATVITLVTPTANQYVGRNAIFSRNSRTVFYTARVGATMAYDLSSVAIDGTQTTLLISAIAQNKSVDAFAFSSNGERLAYALRDLTSTVTELWTMNPDGSQQTRIAALDPNHSVFFLRWSPDDTRILFNTYDISDTENLAIVDAAGATAPVPLTNYTSGEMITGQGGVSWSPDSASILFTVQSTTPTAVSNIFMASASGGGITALTSYAAGNTRSADWW